MELLAYVDLNPLRISDTPMDLLNKIIAYSIIIAFISAVFYILWGGFKLIFSGGDNNKMNEAVSTIRHAIIGLVIVIGAVFAVYVIGQFFNMDIGQHLFNYDEIMSDIRMIIDSLSGNRSTFGGGDSRIDYTFDNNL